MRLTILTVTLLLLANIGVSTPLAPPSTGGVGALHHLLKRLGTHRRLLIIGAHPDDEDTSLLTVVARGMGGEAAYLSLSRGEGGQNLIGTELGEGLGLLRSEELLAARSVDGARQYFTRAFDFGFTRSLDETLGFWPREQLLEDAVRVVRRFRPQVIVSVFPPDARAGHGQHQAAGVTAARAFEVAGDERVLPQFEQQGLFPWRPRSLYRAAFFRPQPSNLVLPIGGLDVATGRSFFQTAMASRSMHRSQDMGVLQPIGPRETRVEWIAGESPVDDSLFGGFDTTLTGIADVLPVGVERDRLRSALTPILASIERLRAGIAPDRLSDSVDALVAVVSDLRQAREDVSTSSAPLAARRAATDLLAEKIEIAERAVAVAAGLVPDATTATGLVVAGESVTVQADFYNSGERSVSVAPRLSSWQEQEIEGEPRELAAGQLESWRFELPVPSAAEATVPYFLVRPRRGEMYDWESAPPDVRGEPFAPPPLRVDFVTEIGGVEITLDEEVLYRLRDQAVGELRRPLRVVPPLEVALDTSSIVWPLAAGGTKALQVRLTRNGRAAVRGRLEVDVPAGWPPVEPIPFEVPTTESSVLLGLQLRRPASSQVGASSVGIRALTEDGPTYDRSYSLIDYPHIRSVVRPRQASLEIQSVALELPRVDSVAYVRGASDRVPESLREVGLPLRIVSSGELMAMENGDLDAFDAIVVGSRAYETDSGLGKANQRLLDYVRRGGLLLVQYQQYQFANGNYAPYPLTISRPHDRITDQGAAVELLDPDHPAMLQPHALGAADWRDWVQERGLYFAGTWDDAYQPLLRMRDPGMSPLEGGLLVAHHGEGIYIYTGLAFFRQLPAGVPGAYRLLMNLLDLGS